MRMCLCVAATGKSKQNALYSGLTGQKLMITNPIRKKPTDYLDWLVSIRKLLRQRSFFLADALQRKHAKLLGIVAMS